MKDKINEFESNGNDENIRDLYKGITEFKKGYQPRTNLVKVEESALLADPHKILNRWKNYWSRGSPVSIVSDYGLGDRCSILSRDKGFFL
jgi:hypothetical protein